MERDKAIEVFNALDMSDNEDQEFNEAVKIAIKSIQQIGYLKDRPCAVCAFNKGNGCTKWDCVFEV